MAMKDGVIINTRLEAVAAWRHEGGTHNEWSKLSEADRQTIQQINTVDNIKAGWWFLWSDSTIRDRREEK